MWVFLVDFLRSSQERPPFGGPGRRTRGTRAPKKLSLEPQVLGSRQGGQGESNSDGSVVFFFGGVLYCEAFTV